MYHSSDIFALQKVDQPADIWPHLVMTNRLGIHFVIILALMITTLTFSKAAKSEEEKIVGLEEFLTELDPSTSDIILELLEAQQLPTNKANRMMRKIMRKLPHETLEQLFEIYKNTRDT